MPTFVSTLSVDALAVGEAKSVIVNDWPVLVARTDRGYFGVLDRCSHAGSALSGGRVRHNLIQCPLHGAPFDLATGQCKAGSPYPAIRTFEVRIVNDRLEVAVPDEAPTVHDIPVPTI